MWWQDEDSAVADAEQNKHREELAAADDATSWCPACWQLLSCASPSPAKTQSLTAHSLERQHLLQWGLGLSLCKVPALFAYHYWLFFPNSRITTYIIPASAGHMTWTCLLKNHSEHCWYKLVEQCGEPLASGYYAPWCFAQFGKRTASKQRLFFVLQVNCRRAFILVNI